MSLARSLTFISVPPFVQFSSFVRQLNFYGFRKMAGEGNVCLFRHSKFRSGCLATLNQIKRKTSESTVNKTMASAYQEQISSLQLQVEALKQSNANMWRAQQQVMATIKSLAQATNIRVDDDAEERAFRKAGMRLVRKRQCRKQPEKDKQRPQS